MGAPWYGNYYSSSFVTQTYDSVILMQSIVKEILSYSSPTDLKTHRFVSRQWNEEACKILGKKLQIKFQNYSQIKSYLYGFRYHKDFCANFLLSPEICLQAPIVNNFLSQFGYHIKSIEIRNSNQNQMQLLALRDALYYFLPNLEKLTLDMKISCSGGMFPSETSNFGGGNIFNTVPIPPLQNLKKLSLCIEYSPEMASKIFAHFNTPYCRDPILPIPLLLQEILLAAVNIQEISSAKKIKSAIKTLHNYPEMTDQNVDYFDQIFEQPSSPSDFNIWSSLVGNQGAYYFPNLQKINLNLKVSDQCVQNLANKYFPLTSIDLDLGPYVTNRNLSYLFSSLKETLTNIKLKYDHRERRPDYQCDLPIAEFLIYVTTVDLEGYQGSVGFVQFVPFLKELILRKVRFNKMILRDKDDNFTKPHLYLSSLKVYEDYSRNNYEGPKKSIQMVQKLGRLFPSLRRLRLEKLVDESLSLVYLQWPYLEELDIVEGLFTDAGTTGIHPNAYRVILREESYDLFNVEALRQGLYIGNLTKLTKLRIHSPKITDVTTILGCVRCPNLKSLYVQSYWITDASLRRLLTKPNLVQIEMENCPQLSQELIAFAKQKFNQVKLNEYKGTLNCFKIRDFLRKNPKAKIVLKRINNLEKETKVSKIRDVSKVVSNLSNANTNTIDANPDTKIENSQSSLIKRKYKKHRKGWLKIGQRQRK